MVSIKPRYFWIALALALYLFFSLTYLQLPGLQYDEVNFSNAALGNFDGPFVVWSAKIFGKRVPLMIMEYIGALKSALYFPIFKLFGAGASSVRLPVVAIGVITLLIAYGLYRRMFDGRIAILGLILFATDPTFIFANKLDWGPVSLLLALELLSLYFMWRWMTEGKRNFLAVAGLFFGLGLYNKIIFAWFIAGFFIALLLCYRESVKKLLHWRSLICFIPAFLLGSLPLIAFNIARPMGTFQNQPVLTLPGLDALHYRYLLISGTLDGSGVYALVNSEDVGHPADILAAPPVGKVDRLMRTMSAFPWVGRSPLPLVFYGSLALILLWCFRRLPKKREIVFIGIQLLVIVFFISANENATGAHHIIVFYPFVFILVAFAVIELGRWLGKWRTVSGILVGACLLPLITAQIVVDTRHLRSFRVFGGNRFWSDAIYDLASFTRQNSDKNYLLMEWGVGTQLLLLTNGRIQYDELSCSQKDLEACIDPVLNRMNTYYVFYVPPFEDQPLLNAFKQALAKRNLQGRILKTFYQRDSRPVYAVYEVINPVLDAYAQKGGFYYLREGEDYDANSGGGLDLKAGASNKKALGNFWGRRQEDFVSYKFTLARSIADARLYLHYAFGDAAAREYYLLIDGNFFDKFALPSTQGYGDTPEQWKTYEIRLGNLTKGTHELTLKPGQQDQILNLDYWYLSEGSFQPAH
jgi:4-amino-4-deoxy-L-arabinose transferase-like glycosyltransferase